MLSRFYLTRAFKGITLFVLMAFTSSLWVGCSETKLTESQGHISTARPAVYDEEGGSSPKAVLLSEQEETALTSEALSLPEGQTLRDSLGLLGYTLKQDLAVGAKKTNHPNSGASILMIPFGLSSDSTKAAFIVYAKWGLQYDIGVAFHVSQVDSPTTAVYEELMPGLWQLQQVNNDSPDAEKRAVTLKLMRPSKVNDFNRCMAGCMAQAAAACAIACALAGPGWPACFAACMAAEMTGCLAGCFATNYVL